MAEVSFAELPLDECHCTLLMISQDCFRLWLGAVRQQAITWTDVHLDLGNKIIDHSDVVGASPVGAAQTASSFST